MTTTNEQTIENAYLYSRVSRGTQSKGVGLTRQDDNADAVCKQNGWKPVSKTLIDLGYSASKGENLFRLDAALRNFVDAAKTEKLLPNPVLIIDDFSRFSRLDIDQSEPQFLELLRLGVAIHNIYTRKTYTKSSAKDAMARIEILLGFKMAYEYTANLSENVNDAFRRKYEHAAKGEAVQFGHWQPAWINFIGIPKQVGNFQLNAIAPIIREIVLDYLDGKSMVGIANRLNGKKVPCIGKGTKKGKRWTQGQVKYILDSPSLVGTISINGKKYEHYYPSVITDDEHRQLQTKLEERKGMKHGPRAGENIVNLFRNRVRCSNCDGPVWTHQGKVKAGLRYYYKCGESRVDRSKCDVRMMLPVDLVEMDFFLLFLQQHPSELLGKNTTNFRQKIANVNARIKEIEKEQEDAANLIGKFPVKAIEQKMTEIQSRMDALTKERETLNRSMMAETNTPEIITNIKKSLATVTDEFGDLDIAAEELEKSLKNRQTREKLMNLLPSLVDKIIIDFNAGSYSIHTRDGNKTDFRSVVELPTIKSI